MGRLLVALDLDGTLLAPDGTVSPRVKAGVRAVHDAGHAVVLATGRSLHGTAPTARLLGLQDEVVVCSNGAVTARADGSELLDVVTFDARPAVALLQAEMPRVVFAVEEVGRGYFTTGPFPDGELDGHLGVVPLNELVAEPVTRVVVRDVEGDVDEFLDVVDRVGLHGVSYAVGYSAWLDLMPLGVSKASALEHVRERLAIDDADTVAIGDGRNDLEMLTWAARGVAMGHAPDVVKVVADEVTASFEEDGAALVLESLP